jgi:hypothetical protein
MRVVFDLCKMYGNDIALNTLYNQTALIFYQLLWVLDEVCLVDWGM